MKNNCYNFLGYPGFGALKSIPNIMTAYLTVASFGLGVRGSPLKQRIASSKSLLCLSFFSFFCKTLHFWGVFGPLGVRILPEMDTTPRPTSFMRPLYSYSAPKVVYTLFKRTCGNLRKLVKIIYFCCFPILKWGKKYQNSIFLIFPRSNQKLLISLV